MVLLQVLCWDPAVWNGVLFRRTDALQVNRGGEQSVEVGVGRELQELLLLMKIREEDPVLIEKSCQFVCGWHQHFCL